MVAVFCGNNFGREMLVYSFSNTLYEVGDFFLLEKKVLVLERKDKKLLRSQKQRVRSLVLSPSVAGHHLSSFCTCQIREESGLESDLCVLVCSR